MSIVSEIWTWQNGARVYSRLTTNVCAERFLDRLRRVEVLELAETIHAYFGDRVNGGNGYEVLWKRGVELDGLRERLLRV